MINSYVVKDSAEYLRLMELVRLVFTEEARLPQQVFKRAKCFRFCEFEQVMSTAFWRSVQKIAVRAGDADITCVVLDPRPEYFHAHFGYYGMLHLDVSDPTEAYEDLFAAEPSESPADAFLYNCEILAACSPSLQWQLWAERSLGIAVVAANDEALLSADNLDVLHWTSAPAVLDDIVALCFRDQVIPAEFERLFLQNYD